MKPNLPKFPIKATSAYEQERILKIFNELNKSVEEARRKARAQQILEVEKALQIKKTFLLQGKAPTGPMPARITASSASTTESLILITATAVTEHDSKK